MSTVDAIGWATVVRGPFRAGRAEPAAVVTCYVCQVSQLYVDRPEDCWQIRRFWVRDERGWRHKKCRHENGRK